MSYDDRNDGLDLLGHDLADSDIGLLELMRDSGKVSGDELLNLLDIWSMEGLGVTPFLDYLEEHRIIRPAAARGLRTDGRTWLDGQRLEAVVSLVALKVKLRVCRIQSHRDPDASSFEDSREHSLLQAKAPKAASPAPAAETNRKPSSRLKIVRSAVPGDQPPPPEPQPADAVSLQRVIAGMPATACQCQRCQAVLDVSHMSGGSTSSCTDCAMALQVPANAFAAGSVVLGEYVIQDRLGLGANGIVYRARQRSLGRDIALKVLLPRDATGLNRFQSECRTLAQLQHGNIVQAYSASVIGPCGLLAMELVRGQSLADHMEPGSIFETAWTLAIAGAVADALDFAWDEVEVVHRDIKPGNILLDDRERPKLADFGLALSREAVEVADDDRILGTPAYMAPENILGHPLDFRADIYSLGVILYQMLTGIHPFSEAETPRQMLELHVHGPVPAPSRYNSELPACVDALVLRMMAKQPDDRHGSYDDLLHDLRECLAHETTDRPPQELSRAARRLLARA